MKDVISQLREIQQSHDQLNPDRVWVEKNKEQMLHQISNTTSDATKRPIVSADRFAELLHIFVPQNMQLAAKPLFTLIAVIGVAIGGWSATVSASQSSLPGDALWGVKLAAERTQVAVASVGNNSEVTAQLHMEFAQRRADELKQIATQDVQDSGTRATKAIEKMQKSLASAQTDLAALTEQAPERVVDVAKDITEQTDEIASTLDDVIEDATQDKDEAEIAIETVKATQVVQETGLDVLVVALEQEDTQEGVEEVKEIITKKIETITQQAAENAAVIDTIAEQNLIEDIVESTEEDSEEAEESTTETSSTEDIAVTTTENIATTTEGVSTTISENIELNEAVEEETVSEDVAQAVEEAQTSITESAEAVAQEAEEIIELVEDDSVGALQEAIEKVKELSAVTHEATEKVVEIQTITPPVSVEEMVQEVAETTTSTEAVEDTETGEETSATSTTE